MRLFTACPAGHKLYLTLRADTRTDLAPFLEVQCPKHGRIVVPRASVFAEESSAQIESGAVIGGLVGLVGGPLGVLVGGTLGALFGANSVNTEQDRVRRFNESWG